MPKSDHSIRIATLRDLSYVIKLQRIWSNQVGFLPKPALERYIENQSTLLVRLNNQHAGYLSWALSRKGLLRLNQLAIDPELLRGKLGTDIVHAVERAARKGSCSVVRFQTRIDLEANLFWADLGYTTTAIFQHPTARRKALVEWTKCLLNPATITEAIITRARKFKRRAQFPEPQISFAESSS